MPPTSSSSPCPTSPTSSSSPAATPEPVPASRTARRRPRNYWRPSEDAVLFAAISGRPAGTPPPRWSALARLLPGRTPKDCRKRWVNVAHASAAARELRGRTAAVPRPGAGAAEPAWTADEDAQLLRLWAEHGPAWRTYAPHFNGERRVAECRNRCCQLLGRQFTHEGESEGDSAASSPAALASGSSASSVLSSPDSSSFDNMLRTPVNWLDIETTGPVPDMDGIDFYSCSEPAITPHSLHRALFPAAPDGFSYYPSGDASVFPADGDDLTPPDFSHASTPSSLTPSECSLLPESSQMMMWDVPALSPDYDALLLHTVFDAAHDPSYVLRSLDAPPPSPLLPLADVGPPSHSEQTAAMGQSSVVSGQTLRELEHALTSVLDALRELAPQVVGP